MHPTVQIEIPPTTQCGRLQQPDQGRTELQQQQPIEAEQDGLDQSNWK